jgi:hypothetical protein
MFQVIELYVRSGLVVPSKQLFLIKTIVAYIATFVVTAYATVVLIKSSCVDGTTSPDRKHTTGCKTSKLFVRICQLAHKLKLGTGIHPDTHTENTTIT